jgi:hypothetical protein
VAEAAVDPRARIPDGGGSVGVRRGRASPEVPRDVSSAALPEQLLAQVFAGTGLLDVWRRIRRRADELASERENRDAADLSSRAQIEESPPSTDAVCRTR